MAMAADQVNRAYRAYSRELYGLARRSLGDPGHAEEAVQECFLRAWRFRRRYESARATDRTWLFAILRNVIADMARAEARHPAILSGDPSQGPLARTIAPDPSPFESTLLAFEVRQAMDRIGEPQRRVIVEVYLNGHSQAQVARRLGVPEGTVKSRLHYGLRALRGALEERGYDS